MCLWVILKLFKVAICSFFLKNQRIRRINASLEVFHILKIYLYIAFRVGKEKTEQVVLLVTKRGIEHWKMRLISFNLICRSILLRFGWEDEAIYLSMIPLSFVSYLNHSSVKVKSIFEDSFCYIYQTFRSFLSTKKTSGLTTNNLLSPFDSNIRFRWSFSKRVVGTLPPPCGKKNQVMWLRWNKTTCVWGSPVR